MYACEWSAIYKYLYCSCIALKSGHPQGASGDCATHRQFGVMLLQFTKCVLSEESIDENRGAIAVWGTISDES